MITIGKTSNEVKSRWIKANYRKYLVQFRVEDDKELIDFIEQNKDSIGTTELFRRAVELLKKEGLN